MNTAVYFSSESAMHANTAFILHMVEMRLLKLDKRPRCGSHTRYNVEILPSTPGSRPKPRATCPALGHGAVQPCEVLEGAGPGLERGAVLSGTDRGRPISCLGG